MGQATGALGIALVAALLASPATASAMRVEVSGNDISVQDGSVGNFVVISAVEDSEEGPVFHTIDSRAPIQSATCDVGRVDPDYGPGFQARCPRGRAGEIVINMAGDDDLRVSLGLNKLIRVNLGDGDDRMLYGHDVFEIFGGAGNDVVQPGCCGSENSFPIRGGPGNDTLRGTNSGFDGDELFGGAGNDRLFGFTGPDRLSGGTGRDRCDGGPGRDQAKDCEVKISIP